MKNTFISKIRLLSLVLGSAVLMTQCEKKVVEELPEIVLSDKGVRVSALASAPSVLNMDSVTSDSGHAYSLKKNFQTSGDSNNEPYISVLKIYENGIELGPAHAVHNDIRNLGEGRFSHWGNRLYFSASDNTDPRTNGRVYTYSVGEAGPIGYANVDGLTTGGEGGDTVVVYTLPDLIDAASSSSPLCIFVADSILGSGYINVNSNKTIVGLSGSSLEGFGLFIYDKNNIIIKNMTIRNVETYTNIIIKENSHHVWVDHCTLSSILIPNDWETYDGLLDVTGGASYVTVSWSKFSNSHIPILIGGGDYSYGDIGKLKVTLYNNYFHNVSERQPRVRFGTVHVFNNYFKDVSGYSVGSSVGATVRTDNNYFEDVNMPITTVLGTSQAGYISGESTNSYLNSGSNNITTTASTWLPPYSYQSLVIPAANVPAIVLAGAGAN